MNILSLTYKATRKLFEILIVKVYNPFNKLQLIFNDVQFGKSLSTKGLLRIKVTRRGDFKIGDNCRFNSGQRYNVSGGNQRCHFWVEGKLSLGNHVGISSSSILCKHQIFIGNYVTIGGNTLIIDSDSHSTNPKHRETLKNDIANAQWGPVIIKDRVFIGSRCIILKGVTIGENSIIGAGSVIAKSVPPNEIWAGNPARKIKGLN